MINEPTQTAGSVQGQITALKNQLASLQGGTPEENELKEALANYVDLLEQEYNLVVR